MAHQAPGDTNTTTTLQALEPHMPTQVAPLPCVSRSTLTCTVQDLEVMKHTFAAGAAVKFLQSELKSGQQAAVEAIGRTIDALRLGDGALASRRHIQVAVWTGNGRCLRIRTATCMYVFVGDCLEAIKLASPRHTARSLWL